MAHNDLRSYDHLRSNIITLVALAISALGFNTARQNRGFNSQSDDISEEFNISHLMDEMSTLNALIAQLNSDTQKNIYISVNGAFHYLINKW